MKKLLPLILFFLPLLSHAQIDNEFWFAAPDLTKGTGNESRRDSTVYLVFTTLSEASNVRISQPANLSFVPIDISLAANSTQSVNLGQFLSLIESKPADAVLNTGLLIRCTNPLTVYYEVRGNANSDLFALKGKNALGKKFYTPFQTERQNNQMLNGQNYIPGPRSGFIVMAKFDSTSVTITPTQDLVGHPADETFSITLNRGQTYFAEAVNWEAGSQPAGSLIESDKEITVTIKDDMIDLDPSNDSGADVVGDQLIPVEYLGKTYILVRGGLTSNGDRAILCATEDNTDLYIDGSSTPITINAGEQYQYQMESTSTYVEASKKIAVLHVTGLGDQLCGAIIPSLDCTGSEQVGFVRGTSRPFLLNITIRAGGEEGFILNGDPNLIPASAFEPVVGTNGYFVFARIEYSTSDIPVNQANLVTNNSGEVFNLGITNGNSGSSCSYGYFSSFSFLNIGKNSAVCLGDSLILNAGPGKTAYLWNTGDTTQTITVYEAGTYYVDAYFGTDCVAADTIEVSYYEPPIDLGANDTICAGTSLTFQFAGNYLFTWQDGSHENSFTVTDSGFYYVDVSDYQQCTTRDSVHIAISPRPETPELTGEAEYCTGESIELFMNDFDGVNYRYILPSGETVTGQDLVIDGAQTDMSGRYYGYYVKDGCETFNDSIDVLVHPLPVIDLGTDISVCNGTDVTLDPGLAVGNFEWQDGSTDLTYFPTQSGTYTVTVTDVNMCSTTDSVEVEFKPLPENPIISGDTDYCAGEDVALNTDAQSGASYSWIDPQGNVTPGENEIVYASSNTPTSGEYSLVIDLSGCLSDTAYANVNIHPNPQFNLMADTTICDGSTIVLSGPDGYSYEWSNDETSQTIEGGSGNFMLTITDENGCSASDEVVVSSAGPSATITVLPSNEGFPGFEFTLNGDAQNGSTPIANWTWNFGDGATDGNQNTTHIYTSAGIYTISLNVSDDRGCESASTEIVSIKNNFKIPDGFSPNGDGVNDTFVILGLELKNDVKLQIFNRWGAIVFESSDYKPGNFWDGGDHTDGTYFYILQVPGMDAKSGAVTIAR